jgi:hypothetical protein
MIIRSLFCLISIYISLIAAGQGVNNQKSVKLTEAASSSVLATGTWYKIKIKKDGIYKLTYEDIKSMGFSNPEDVRIFGNGGKTLPLMNSEPRPDDLVENNIYMNKGSDEIFNQGDFILFFGKGPVTWSFNQESGLFEHQLNPYSDASYYFVTTEKGIGKKISFNAALTGNPDLTVTEFDDYAYHEKEQRNFLKSGRQWFGERIEYSAYDTTFNFTGLVTSSPVKVKLNVVSRSANNKLFILRNNEHVIGSISVNSVILSNTTGLYANQKSAIFDFSVTDDEINLNISYNKTESSDEGFLDYLTVNVRRTLSLNEDALFFRDRSSTGLADITRFSINNCNSTTEIWNVTDFNNIKRIESQLNGSILTFKDSTKALNEYVAVNISGNFPKPEIINNIGDVGPVSNQNLHATGPQQMLIITHPLFLAAADSIALFHRLNDNLSVCVATTDQVYNEFSSGARDISAIRDFAKMIYDRAIGTSDRLRYLLLLGDGSYNNLSRDKGNSNYILTYQSESSLNATSSYVSDDFFGFMDDNEGGSEYMESYMLDLGVGRLPAKTVEEALTLYKKIKNYKSKRNMADWRNNILFVGDDEDGNLHMTQANSLADWVRNNYPQFVVKKLLLDAYKQVSTSTGARYPEVNRIITNDFNKGILIYNYTGHGGERGMAAEQILMREDLQKLTNRDNLPLFITATCEFSRFDDLTDDEGSLIESTSAGETTLLNENGGCIALLSTTRIVYSDRNHYLNTKFYRVAFMHDENGEYFKLGDIIRMTKDSSGIQRNKLNFILLGDPALTLAVPENNIVTDSINGNPVMTTSDTIKAFSRIRISGHLEDPQSSVLNNYNGIIYPSVFDKSQIITTLANDGDDPIQFESQENIIYKGKASVINGYFTFEFIVPKDITYSYGNGKIVYYAQDSIQDGNGYFNEFIIGGTDIAVVQDTEGPDISLYLNDENFNNQGISNASPVIFALISDESGINTVGNGIGHDIAGIIDADISDPIILNDFFESDLDDYRKGSLAYQMHNLSEGWHSLKVKVWDVFNNSSEKSIEFKVVYSEELTIANVYNYPNPVSDFTWFRFEHNKPGDELQVTITVYDMQGRIITIINEICEATGFASPPILWEIKDMNGNNLRQGIYPYKIRITNQNGSFAESCSKLVVIRQ